MRKSNTKMVPAVVRGVAILDIVSKSKRSLTISEICGALEIPKSTVHGLCSTFVELNLLVRKSDQSYQLGPHIMRWSNRFIHESDVATEFASIWDESSDLPGATITLSVLEGAEVVYVAARNAALSVGYNFRIGMRLPAAFTATGKCLLSHMTNSEVRRLVGAEFPCPLTEYSVATIDGLIEELVVVRAKGYSIDNQQVNEGMVCCGAAVLNSQNQPIAGIAVSLSFESMASLGQDTVAKSMQDMSKKISFRLGAEL